ncbi:MAG: hypothetical protein OIF32_08805, partial [Campylobacterales bacterium]|nr:hypothetical protein [Campylobacterales bacterium]
YIQKTVIKVNGKIFSVGNIHLEAFHKKTRMNQASKLKKYIEQNEIDLFGGDFNTVQGCATKKRNFSSSKKEDYLNDSTYSIFSNISSYYDSLLEESYLLNQNKWFTFPSDDPDRKLDYIFIKDQYEVVDLNVIKSDVSDHLPIVLTFKF